MLTQNHFVTTFAQNSGSFLGLNPADQTKLQSDLLIQKPAGESSAELQLTLDVAALTASKLVGVNRTTSQRIYECLRRRVVEWAMEEARPFTGEVEIDESYFGPRRVRGRRGRGAGGKRPVI